MKKRLLLLVSFWIVTNNVTGSFNCIDSALAPTMTEAMILCNSVNEIVTKTYPAEVLDLLTWKVLLPIGEKKAPIEITHPTLANYFIEPYFKLSPSGKCVVFNANVGGVTTPLSQFPRSELREMTNNGMDRASWSTAVGKHTMTSTQAITHLPKVKPEVSVIQIHDPLHDILMVRLVRRKLYVKGNNPLAKTSGNPIVYGVLDHNYILGTFFKIKIVVESDLIQVFYNNMLHPAVTFSLPVTINDCYFKAGAYTLSNVSKGDSPTAYGESVFTELSVTHE